MVTRLLVETMNWCKILTEACLVGQEGQRLQSQVVWRADQLYTDVTERRKELEQLRLSATAANAQRSVGDVDNDLDTVEADKAVAERAKDEISRKQGRLRYEVPVMMDPWLALCVMYPIQYCQWRFGMQPD